MGGANRDDIRITERDLLMVASTILAIVHTSRAGGSSIVRDASTDLQLEVIALAARGRLTPPRLAQVPDDAFTGAPRLFAWACASRACRCLGKRATFFHARYVLATSPNFMPTPPPITKADVAAFREEHGYEATVEWLESIGRDAQPGTMAWLRRETEAEIDMAEAQEPRADALPALLVDHRRRLAQAWIEPVITGMASGAPMTDTAARLRQAADIFDGKTGGRA